MYVIDKKSESYDNNQSSTMSKKKPSFFQKTKIFIWKKKINVIVLFIPNIISLVYFSLIASPIYISTTSLVVKNPVKDNDSITSLFAGSSGSSSDGAYILKEFINSWDEYRVIDSKFNLSSSYSDGDLYSKYAGLGVLFQDNDVVRWHYYKDLIDVNIDEQSGIMTINTRGFRPDIAKKIAQTVVEDAISHINLMNKLSEEKFVQVSKMRTSELQKKISSDEMEISFFRTQKNIFDTKQYNNMLLNEFKSLTEKSINMNLEIKAINHTSPKNPVADSYKIKMREINKAISGVNNNITTITQMTPFYNALILKRDSDVSLLKQALIAEQEAMFKASQNRYSLNIISKPSFPHSPELPKRFWNILKVAALTALVRLIAG